MKSNDLSTYAFPAFTIPLLRPNLGFGENSINNSRDGPNGNLDGQDGISAV